jgi:hypothetical protein
MGDSGLIGVSAPANVYSGVIICDDGLVSPDYTKLIKGVTWDTSGLCTISITNLQIGSSYKVQIWYQDSDSSSDQAAYTIDSVSGVTNWTSFNCDVGGGLGQYVIGTFRATAYEQKIGLDKRVFVSGNGNPAFNAIQVRELGWIPVNGFQSWMASFGVTNSAPDADDDSDGADNLYEYALNGDPTNALDTGSAPVIEPDGASIGYVYLKRDDPDLTYTLRIRSDLVYGDWSTNGFSVTEGVIDSIWKAVTNSVPLSGNDKLFYDLKIEQQ